jgi:hypothetical protein
MKLNGKYNIICFFSSYTIIKKILVELTFLFNSFSIILVQFKSLKFIFSILYSE